MQLLKRLSLWLLFITGTILNAQDECGTDMSNYPNSGLIHQLINQNVTMDSFSDSQPYVIKVHFWDFRQDNGENIQVLEQNQMLEVVAGLNQRFNHFNVFFKMDGGSFIDSTTWYEIEEWYEQRADLKDFLREPQNHISGVLNMYAFEVILPQLASAIWDDTQGQYMGVAWRTARFTNNPIWAHEVGHCFDLSHTFETIGGIENVDREGEPNFNADEAGDDIIDTFATPEGMSNGIGYNINTCEYTDMTATDAVGRLYSDYEPEVTNYMSYSSECRARFSPGQIAVMRAQIDHLKDHPSGLLFIDNFPISILYEPYTGFYAPYFPYVGNELPLFQPGFTYRFVACECECPQPTDFYNTNFTYSNTSLLTIAADETDYSLIAHPNHSAITIAEVPEIFGNPQEERRCWDNWVTPPVIGGTVTLFNDGVFNTNVTVMPQDSTQINNPNLINDLDNGLYNIKKHVIDGTVNETNILKENE